MHLYFLFGNATRPKSCRHILCPPNFTFFIALFISCISGCGLLPRTASYDVEVDAIALARSRELKTFTITSGDPDISNSDIRFKEFASMASKGLAKAGFVHAKNPSDAEIEIRLLYEISQPEQHVVGHGNEYGSRVESFNIYKCKLEIQALPMPEKRDANTQSEIWRTTVISRGISNDLRQVFPALVSAAVPYLGRDTGQKARVVVREDDEQLVEIRNSRADSNQH